MSLSSEPEPTLVKDAAGHDQSSLIDADNAFHADMETCFKGYEDFEYVYASNQLYFIRARDSVRGLRVYFRAVLSQNHIDAMTRIRHEWNCQLVTAEVPGIKKPHAMESCNDGQGLMLVFADDGEQTAYRFFGREIVQHPAALEPASIIDIGKFLDFAIDITNILGSLHGKGITHGNINPHSIGVDRDLRGVIGDLTCSTFLEREDAYKGVISTTQLPFMSPESSGRINRSVDYRTDFYSLGITFYFLLTGVCPFVSDHALDLIYQHIAHEAVPPHKVCPNLSESISAVVLKLMSKTAEDRYQTALGLASDLSQLRDYYQQNGDLNVSFTPGLTDAASQFSIPQQLFGREQDIQGLLGCFRKVKETGGCSLVIVKGGSGTGKSSLVNEIHRPVLETKSFFASGKFDQYKRGVPFFSLIQAGGELVRQLVSENELVLSDWKASLLDAMGTDAAAVFDVLPELQALFPEVEFSTLTDLGPVEREQRFTAAFIRFILVFGRRNYPLVLFLDDIQWSSVVELNLIAKLAITANSDAANSLCLIIAYRDNEVPEGHHALSVLREISEAKVPVRAIDVKPMSFTATREMIAATVRTDPNAENTELETLTKLIMAQSAGNAFFITQLLKNLKDCNHVFFDFEHKTWRFDLPAILREELPLTVIDLLLSQIQQLEARTQHCLHMAACIGTNRFSLRLLAAVTEQSSRQTAKGLWHALQAGLIVPTSSAYKQPLTFAEDLGNTSDDSMEEDAVDATYRFLHDRVQQAAYQLVPPEEQPRIHLTIGMRLLKYCDSQGLVDTYIFEVVNQINRGLDLLEHDSIPLAIELNVRAGKRALQSTAFDAALSYLETAKNLVPEAWWQDRFEQTLDIHLAHVDATYANNDYDTAISNLQYMTTKARSPYEKAKIMSKMVDAFNVLDNLESAIDTGIAALDLLGFSIPRTANAIDEMKAEMLPKLVLSPDQLEDISRRELSKDAGVVLLQELVSACILPVYCSRPELLQIMCGHVLLLSLQHGLSDAGAYSLLMFGVTLTHAVQSTESERLQGYHMGRAAVKIIDSTSAVKLTSTTPKVLKVFASHICWWNEPARACLVYFNSALSTGLQTFNVEYTCYAYTESCTYAFLSGEGLQSVVPRMAGYLPLIKKYKQKQNIWYCSIQLQAYVNFTQDRDDPGELDGEYFSDALEHDAVIATNSHPQNFVLDLYKLMVGVYFHRQQEECLSYNKGLEEFAEGCLGTAYIAKWSFLLCSCLVANLPSLSPTLLAKFYDHFSRLKFYRTGEASSFTHEILFIEAETLRHQDDVLGALEKFEEAYDFACDVGNLHEAGHFAERTYRWLESKGSKLGTKYLFRAYDCFKAAGLKAKVRDLLTKYPDLLSQDALGQHVSAHLVSFRNVNMQINRDGSLSKIQAPPMQADQLTEYTADTRMSKVSKRSKMSDIRSTHRPGSLQRLDSEVTPTGTLSSHPSKHSRKVQGLSLSSKPSIQESASEKSEGLDLDLDVALKASVLISDVLQVSMVLERLVETVLMNAGADYGALLLSDGGDLYVEATGQNACVQIVKHASLSTSKAVPSSLVNYVGRLKQTVVLGTGDNKTFEAKFGADPYFTGKRLRSVMCMPVQNAKKLIGVLYLENSITAYAFGPRRVELLNFLCSQAAIAIEKARLYSDLEVAKNEAQASNKMKSEFLSTISHEIRTPFNSVLGMSGFLLDTKLTPMQVDYVETIRNSSKELLRVIDDILDFSKMEHGTFELHKEKFSLRECIEGAMQITAERAASKNLELAYFNTSNDFPDILINDITRFRQVVINLLGNSIKFTERGSITLTSSATLLREAGEQDALYRIQVSVKDTGIGIKQDDHEKLFKLFSQIDSSLARSFSGTGLGLAISEKLVRLMDGQIWVDSTPGIGSTFHFTITTEVKQARVEAPKALVEKLKGHTVLLLDHSKLAAKSLTESLQWLGLRVVVVDDLETTRKFSIALIDIDHDLGQFDPSCKVIRLARFGVKQQFEKHHFLIKPVKRERLARVIAEALFPDWIHDEAPKLEGINPIGLANRHPLRILLAEDNMINARVALQHLKRMGYSAVHAKDGQYAIEEESKNIYDVILMDVQMPRLDGCQAATQLRQKYQNHPGDCPRIIAMTANAMRGDMERCLDAGMHAYTAKPIIVDILAQKLLEVRRR